MFMAIVRFQSSKRFADKTTNGPERGVSERIDGWVDGLVCWFYGISTFVGYLTPNPFLCK